MNPISPRLRQIHNGGNSVAKVSLVIPAGDDLAVSDYVADQLQRQGAFKDGAAPHLEVEEAAAAPVTKAAGKAKK
jgi:hypothetical protein